jgi:branched-chain amino acid transport system substrate-binding protein
MGGGQVGHERNWETGMKMFGISVLRARRVFAALGIGGAVLVVLTMMQEGPAAAAAAKAPITIGVDVELSGAGAVYGLDLAKGVKLAVAYVNSHGGADGRQLTLDTIDNQSLPQVAVAGAEQLAANKSVAAVIGGDTTFTAPAMWPTWNGSHIPDMAPTGAALAIEFDGADIFHYTPSYQQDAAAILSYCAKNLKKLRIGLEYDSSSYGTAVASAMAALAARYGDTIVASQEVSSTATDDTPAVQAVLAKNPGVFVSVHTGNVSTPITNLRSLNQTVPLVLGRGAANPATLEGANQAAIGAAVITSFAPGVTNARNKAFVAAFQKAYQSAPDTQNANGWDGVMLLVKAIQVEKGAATRSAIQAGLNKIKRFSGAAGVYSFSPTNHQAAEAAGLEWIKYTGNGDYAFITDAASAPKKGSGSKTK